MANKLMSLFLAASLIFTPQFARAALSDADKAFIPQYELLANPGFELSTAGWTTTGGTLSTTTASANKTKGAAGGSWAPTTSGQILASNYTTVTSGGGLSAQNGDVSCMVKSSGALASHVLQVYDGTNVVASLTMALSSSAFKKVVLNFPFPVSGTIRMQIISGASDTLYLDECHLEPATNVYSVNANITAWQSYTPVVTHNSGGATNYTISGQYRQNGDSGEFRIHMAFSATSAAFNRVFLGLPSGLAIDTNKISNLSQGLGSGHLDNWAGGYSPAQILYHDTTSVGVFTYLTLTGSNPVRLNDATLNGSETVNGTAIDVQFTVPIVGWGAGTVYKPDAGGLAAGDILETAATSCPIGTIVADGTSLLRADYPALFQAIGTTYGAADGSHFTLPDGRGVFLRGAGSQTISSVGYTGTQGTTQGDQFQDHAHTNTHAHSITDQQHSHTPADGNLFATSGPGGVAVGGTAVSTTPSTAPSYTGITGTNNYTGNTGSQTGSRGGTETRPANISILRCIRTVAASPAPLLVGSVTSNTTGMERVERATITPANSGSCAINSQTGSWISSCTATAAGDCSCTLVTGSFSSTPSCQFTSTDSSSATNVLVSARGSASSATAMTFKETFLVSGSSTVGPTNSAVNVQCMGPR